MGRRCYHDAAEAPETEMSRPETIRAFVAAGLDK